MEEKSFKIVSIDGSRVVQMGNNISIRTISGAIDFSRFEGYLDYSLDTVKLAELYQKEKRKGFLKEPFCIKNRSNKDESIYTTALIKVSFDYVVKEYKEYKQACHSIFVREGCSLNEIKLDDSVSIKEENGKQVLAAIKIFSEETNQDICEYVQNPIGEDLLGSSFGFDLENRLYYRTEAPIITETNAKEIRNNLYTNGFWCDGIHYVRYKRSAGSSREGQCLFIPEVLYDDMMKWSCCGIDGSKVDDQASFQAYLSLTLSSLQKTIKLSKKAILLLPDQESVFETDAIRVFRDEKTNKLLAREERLSVKNKIWDGEGLLDESVFEENGLSNKGMMLLRNRFFKTCAFNTKLKKWFYDHQITDISQLNGCYRRGAKLEDIKLVITESSLKYCKMVNPEWSLQKKLDQWIDQVFDHNEIDFGLVKTEGASGIMDGRMVRTNYQIINTIGLKKEEVKLFLKESFDLLDHMMEEPAYLRYYIHLLVANEKDELNEAIATTNARSKAIMELLKKNDDFAYTRFFSDFRGDVLKSFKRKLKMGRVPIDGTYATLFGNGAELLQSLVDRKYKVVEPLALKENEIRTTQFDYSKELLCARSPHITMGNLFVAYNVDNDVYRDYFNFEQAHEIVCVNAINHNIQQRLNGCDYDSDTMLITDNSLLLETTKRDVNNFPVPVGDFSSNDVDDERYDFKPLDLAKLDVRIAENRIGEIINLSQFLNTLYWDRISKGENHEQCRDLYLDICKLAVLSGIEIDKAKRSNKVNTYAVLSEMAKEKIKFKSEKGELPAFYTFLTTEQMTSSKTEMNTSMSFLYEAVLNHKAQGKRMARKKLSDLLTYRDRGEPSLDTNRKKAILQAVEKTKNEIDKNNRAIRMKGEKYRTYYREMNDRAFVQLCKTIHNNMKNDHVLKMIVDAMDDNNNKTVSGFSSLLLSALVYEKDSLLIKKITESGKLQKNIRYSPNNPNPDLKIYGYPHIYSD